MLFNQYREAHAANIPLVLNEGVEGEPQRMGFAPMIIMSGSLCRSHSTPSPILPSVGRGG